MKKTLLLVRHATAEDQSFRIKDFDRNLNSKGLAEAAMMGKWLAASGLQPERFVTSPASRASKTAEIMAGELGLKPAVLVSEAGIYDGGPRAYLGAVNAAPATASSLIVFGHNPDITYFAEYLSGANMGSMKKAGIAIIEFEDLEWNEISAKSGNLRLYITPKEVRDAS